MARTCRSDQFVWFAIHPASRPKAAYGRLQCTTRLMRITRWPSKHLYDGNMKHLAMPPKFNHYPSITCAEHISFLYLLHSVPNQPSHNSLEAQKHGTQGYALSIEEERRLAEALAFLANDSKDNHHIPAICVELCLAKPSPNVWLAVNRLSWQSGFQSLRRLKDGFDIVFATLRNISKGQSTFLTFRLIHSTEDIIRA
jgi:hypothetical protein